MASKKPPFPGAASPFGKKKGGAKKPAGGKKAMPMPKKKGK